MDLIEEWQKIRRNGLNKKWIYKEDSENLAFDYLEKANFSIQDFNYLKMMLKHVQI